MARNYITTDRHIGRKRMLEMYDNADDIEMLEGMTAYTKYNTILKRLNALYPEFEFKNVVAAFVSLSPNNDYLGNLRSTLTLMHWTSEGAFLDDIKVSTYNHCRDRAYHYLCGLNDFEKRTKGPKILSFYNNILDPCDKRYVTVDGHMIAIWQGNNGGTMKDFIINKTEYNAIRDEVVSICRDLPIIPNQFQAIVWHVRKRILKIKFNPNLNLLDDTDHSMILRDVEQMKPYDLR